MASGGAPENVVKIIGVICDFTRDAENDYKATRCNIFGLSLEEYTVLSEAAKVSALNMCALNVRSLNVYALNAALEIPSL